MNTTQTTNKPRVYVGTYGKYNRGNLSGAWLNISEYANKAEFTEACKRLHADEINPEFMFQDWANVPEGLITESSINDDLFMINDFAAILTEEEKIAFQFWLSYRPDLWYKFTDCYIGDYSSEINPEEAFAESIAPDFSAIYAAVTDRAAREQLATLEMYFDSAKYARDLFLTDYVNLGGFIFYKGK